MAFGSAARKIWRGGVSPRFDGCWVALAFCVATAVVPSTRADVWKCSRDGRTQYADQPCQEGAKGSQLPQRSLQGNVIDVGRPAASLHASVLQSSPLVRAEFGAAPVLPANVCPSDRDIASMETTANSTTLPADAKRFVQDEIRRARQCQKGQGRYSAADWAISREAVAAQSSLSGAADARVRSESMHSAANPAEGELIARRRDAEARGRRQPNRPAAERPAVGPALPVLD